MKKLKPWLVTLAILAIILFIAFFSSRRSQTVSFAGGTLHLPSPWRAQATGTTAGTLSVRRDNERGSGTLDLLDQRTNPIDATHFLEHWKSVAGTQHFHPDSLGEYHDAAVDAAGLRCVRIEWKREARPLEINCVSGDGQWRIVMLGHDQDIPGLDMLARQMPAFERSSR